MAPRWAARDGARARRRRPQPGARHRHVARGRRGVPRYAEARARSEAPRQGGAAIRRRPGRAAADAVTATVQALSAADREGPAGVPRQDLGAAPPAAAGKERGRRAAPHRLRVRAEGRPAAGDRRAGGRRQRRRRAHAGAARRHRLRQDLHDGEDHRGDAAPGADPRPEQDARRAALRRVQVVLPGERGRVFRLLLRLLPARGLRAADRHLHREGIVDQRADRPHAPLGDALAARARRRDHRRLRLLHLRHRLGRDLHGDDLRAGGRRAHRPAPGARRPGGAAIQAHRHEFRARHLPRARRHAGALPGAPGGPRLAHLVLRRRDRIDPGVRSADRPEDRRPEEREDLRQLALRHAEADAAAGDQGHPRGAEVAARRAGRRPGGCSRRSGSRSARRSTSR